MAPFLFLLLFLSGAASDLIEVTVHPGDDVILPCRADDSSIRVVAWTRSDVKPDIVLYYSDGRLNTTYQHPSFKDRVELVDRDLKDGDVSLTLKNVRSSDAGIYKCRVITGDTDPHRTTRTVRLHVSNQIVATVPGDDVILSCLAPDSSIRAVMWTRPDLEPDIVLYYSRGHLDTDHQHPSFKDRVELVDRDLKDRDASLILKNVNINDTGTYKCGVKTKGSTCKKRDIDSDLTLTTRTVRLLVSDLIVTVDPGHDVILPCQTDDSSIRVVKWTRPDLESDIILLYRDGRLNTTDQHPSFKDRVELVDRDLKDGDVSLILKNVSRHDAGTYECGVKTGDTDPIRTIRTIRLQVPERDLIEVKVHPGDDVILPCWADDSSIRAVKWTRADLEPDTVLYYSDGHLNTTDQNPSFKDRVELVDRDLKDGDVSLTLKNVSSIDAGIYECRVKNDGSTRKKRGIDPIRTVRLQVPEPAGSEVQIYAVVAAGVTALVLIVVVVGVLIYKRNRETSGQPADGDEASTDQLLDNPQCSLPLTVFSCPCTT